MGENFFLKTGSHNWMLCFHSASANFKLSTVNRKTIQLIIPSGLSSYSTPHQFENLLFLSESHTLYPLVHWAMFSCLVYCDFVDPISPSAFIGVITWWTVGAAIGDLVRGWGELHPNCRWMPPKEHSSGPFQPLQYPYPISCDKNLHPSAKSSRQLCKKLQLLLQIRLSSVTLVF